MVMVCCWGVCFARQVKILIKGVGKATLITIVSHVATVLKI